MDNRRWLVLGLVVVLGAQGACGDDSSDDDGGRDVLDVRDVVDEGSPCPSGQDLCGTECVNLQSSHDHCGDCDTACAANEICRAGGCELDCPISPDYDDCGGTECSSLPSDPDNCGACGNVCGPAEVCSCGVCVAECTDLNTDAGNCGICGLACATGEVCCCGGCTTETTCPDPCPMVEIAPLLECGTDGRACVDARSDVYHCGSCDGECGVREACGDGVCTTETCTGVDVYCEGRCVNLANNSEHCGRCQNACNPATEYCLDGTCTRS